MGESGIDRYLQAWTLELTRALTPILQEVPTVSCSRARHLSAVDVTGVLWCRLELRMSEPFFFWIGAREATWNRAGKLQWIRLLDSVTSRAAETLRGELIDPLQVGSAQVVHQGPDLREQCYAVAGLRISRTELPSLLLVLEAIAGRQLLFKDKKPVLSPMLQSLMELELPLSVALGRTRLPIGEVLKITSGSVIHLQGYTGEEVEVLVHGTVVAKGQVVSSRGNYGVRIKEIMSPVDRIQLCAPDE